MSDDRVAREKMVCGQLCVGDRVVDEAEKVSSPALSRAFSVYIGVVGEVRVGWGRRQLALPQSSDKVCVSMGVLYGGPPYSVCFVWCSNLPIWLWSINQRNIYKKNWITSVTTHKNLFFFRQYEIIVVKGNVSAGFILYTSNNIRAFSSCILNLYK